MSDEFGKEFMDLLKRGGGDPGIVDGKNHPDVDPGIVDKRRYPNIDPGIVARDAIHGGQQKLRKFEPKDSNREQDFSSSEIMLDMISAIERDGSILIGEAVLLQWGDHFSVAQNGLNAQITYSNEYNNTRYKLLVVPSEKADKQYRVFLVNKERYK